MAVDPDAVATFLHDAYLAVLLTAVVEAQEACEAALELLTEAERWLHQQSMRR